MIHETALVTKSVCPMWVPPAATPLEVCAQTLLKTALLRVFEGLHGPLTGDYLRERYVALWNQHWFQDRPKVIPDTGPYWEGPRKAASLARKLLELFGRYEVLQPEQPYELHLDEYTIQGRYALVRRRTGNDMPLVFVAHSHAPLYKASPDLRALARHAHVMRTQFARDAGILHVPLVRGVVWKQLYVDEFLAVKYLKSILDQIDQGGRHPVAGPQCLSCVTKPCMEIFTHVR